MGSLWQASPCEIVASRVIPGNSAGASLALAMQQLRGHGRFALRGETRMADRHGSQLTVTGIGQVQVAPDEAIVQLSIVTEAQTAAAAVASNARQTQAVIDAVSEQPNHGVTTSGLSVYPIIDYNPDRPPGQIVGFRATNSVEVTTKVGYVGQIFDAGVAAGANQSSGITFRVQDEAPHREEALRLAIAQAFREAKAVAIAADLELRGVESITVEPDSSPLLFRSEAIAKTGATPVIPGPQTITARVLVQLGTRADHFRFRPGARGERDAKPPLPGSA